MARYLVVGDIHGRFGELKALIAEQKPDGVLATGDFGYWPKSAFFKEAWQDNSTPIYFCEGNHEDMDALGSLTNNEVAPKVFYMKRGSFLELADGRTVVFMGGAQSIDRHHRTVGFDYFPSEVITDDDFLKLDRDRNVDILISHTKPNYFNVGIRIWEHDPSADILDKVFELYQPKQWYFSHWHEHVIGELRGCRWVLLNKVPDNGWWTWL